MTLNVNISVNNPQLLNNNKIDASANRQINLVDRPEQVKVEANAREQREAELKRQGRNPDGTTINLSTNSAGYRPDEIAANRQIRFTPALGFFSGSSQNSTYTFTIYSGDGSASISKSHRLLPFQHNFELKWGLPSYNLINYSLASMVWGPSGTPPSNGMREFWPYDTLYADSNGSAVGFGVSGNVSYAQTEPEGIQYIYTTIRREASRDSNSGIFCFPIGKETFILYYFFYQYFYQVYSGNKVERKDKIQPIGRVNITDYYTGPFGTGTIYAAQRTEQLVDAFTDIFEDQERVEYCFLVGKKTIKEINVPSNLSSLVGSLYPQLIEPIDVPLVQESGYGELRSTVFSVGSPPDLVSGSTTLVNLSLTLNDYFGYEDLTDPRDGDLYPEADIRLLHGYGIGNLNTGNHFGFQNDYFTPGVFSLLENGETVRLYQIDYSNPPYYDVNYINYDYLYNNFLSNTPFRGIYLDINQSGYPYLRGKPVVTGSGAQPIDIYTSVPYELFNKNLRESFPLISGARPIFVWDWGTPNYCRQKLLGIGFSAEDLAFDP